VKLVAPSFPFKQCWDKKAKEMHRRDKQRHGARMELEEGEIVEQMLAGCL
jgi:hypothetical protein